MAEQQRERIRRRVVLGVRDGQHAVLHDGPPVRSYDGAALGLSGEGWLYHEMWATLTAPGERRLDLDDTPNLMTLDTDLPAGATRFRWGRMPAMPAPAVLHATRTLDYVTIVSGEVDLLVRNGDRVSLIGGDCLVIAGAEHAWWNRGPADVVLSIVMIGLSPG